ncbi:hypothetical protein FSARC_12089 [Fusarium sarcochroum]|uniref:Methyltransferase domain-containing protein n=1 Tax=Fusarium sarcochroum TaxID=1208366 RepID=A0A8H4TB20_9HYPO|nr:hypothetical protein FSARC_12089 [Fusarium sarcochroum]
MDAPTDLKDRLRASYNAIAPKYNSWTEQHNHLRQAYLEKLLSHCPELTSAKDNEKKQVLELGCGSGKPFLSNLLLRAPSVHVHANDISDVQLDLARSNLAGHESRIGFYPGDMMKLDFEQGSLTAVVALYSIIHLPQEEQKEIIRRIGRWLAPGGVFLSTFTANEASSIVVEEWIDTKGWMFWSALGQDKAIEALTNGGGLQIEEMTLEGDEEEEFLWVIAKKPAIQHM